MQSQTIHHNRRIFWVSTLGLFAVFCLTAMRAKDQIVGLAEAHFWIEGALAAFSCSVAWLGLRGYLASSSIRLLMLAIAFSISGLLDLVADLVAPGGYQLALFGENGNLSLWLWSISRVIGAIFLFLSIVGPPTQHNQPKRARIIRAAFWGMCAAITILTLVFGLAAIQSALPQILTLPSGHLTGLGIALVSLAAILMAAATRAYLARHTRIGSPTLLAFAFGIVALICSALVALISDVFYGILFWYGDLYQIIGFCAFGYGILLLRRTNHPDS